MQNIQANQLKILMVTWKANFVPGFLMDKQKIYLFFRKTSGLSLLHIDSMTNIEQIFYGMKMRCKYFLNIIPIENRMV